MWGAIIEYVYYYFYDAIVVDWTISIMANNHIPFACREGPCKDEPSKEGGFN